MTDVLSQLQGLIAGAQDAKSSHWRFHTEPSRLDGFGTVNRYNPLRAALHWVGQRVLFPWSDVFRSQEYEAVKTIVTKQGRVLDLDVLRHVFTMRLLRALCPAPGVLCVIGDGRGNLAGLALGLGYVDKVISVNLPEVLAKDHMLLRRGGLVDDAGSVVVATTKVELMEAITSDKVSMILVSAQHAEALRAVGIPLFLNIASFQEMTIEAVQRYMRLIHSNGADIYSCNRQEKTLYGGEIVRLNEYGWQEFDVQFEEECPWHQWLYMFSPPFIRRYDGTIIHTFARAHSAAPEMTIPKREE